jgi:hypothetical protein
MQHTAAGCCYGLNASARVGLGADAYGVVCYGLDGELDDDAIMSVELQLVALWLLSTCNQMSHS